MRDTIPLGIGGINGELTSHRIPGSPAPLLLSLEAQIDLGIVSDLARERADINALGLKNIKLVRTPGGGPGDQDR